MNVLVIGCGRMGASMCIQMEEMGHDVAVLDQDSRSFDLLPDSFTGFTAVGVPIDQDALRMAGIESCDAVVAVTPDDNMNVMVCQIASEIFHVPKVLARVYDPKRGDVFNRLGVRTVSPTLLAAEAVISMLQDNGEGHTLYMDSATVSFVEKKPLPGQLGKTLGMLLEENNGKSGIFGVLGEDGNVSLAFSESEVVVTEQHRLLYVKVVD